LLSKKPAFPRAGQKKFKNVVRVVFSVESKPKLRVPKMQRATFLNKIVTGSTDFSCKILKKYMSPVKEVFIFTGR
jgi:hypothetical protein